MDWFVLGFFVLFWVFLGKGLEAFGVRRDLSFVSSEDVFIAGFFEVAVSGRGDVVRKYIGYFIFFS